MQTKVTTVQEVVKEIPDGAHIGLPGFAVTRNAIAFANEIIRQGKKDLTLSQCIGGMETELLIGAGCVKTMMYSTGSLDRYGPLSNLNRAFHEDRLTLVEYSGLSVTLAYYAGALGVTYMPCNTLLGSTILEVLLERRPDLVKETICPFTGEKQVLVRAVRPDYGVIVANYCDEDGNCVIPGPLWEMKEMATASKKLIVFTEKIVSSDTIRSNPDATVIPASLVDSIVEMPFSAYPTCIYKGYDYDAEHLREFGQIARDQKTMDAYLDEYVRGTKDHEEYLAKFGLTRIMKLQADPYKGY